MNLKLNNDVRNPENIKSKALTIKVSGYWNHYRGSYLHRYITVGTFSCLYILVLRVLYMSSDKNELQSKYLVII